MRPRVFEPGGLLVEDDSQSMEVREEERVLLGVQTLLEPLDLDVLEGVDEDVATLHVVVHHLVLVEVV